MVLSPAKIQPLGPRRSLVDLGELTSVPLDSIMKNEIEIKEGAIFVCDTLRWDEGWEFECPSMMLRPIIRCFENGFGHESIVEDVLIDAVSAQSGKLTGDDFQSQWGWRGYKLPVLRRRFNEALAGKKFPIAGYHATRETVRIIKDEDGELTWEKISNGQFTHS